MAVAYFSNQFADLEGHGIARYSRDLYDALMVDASCAILPVAAWSSLNDEQLRLLKEGTKLQILPTGRRFTPLLWAFLNYPPLENLLSSHEIDLVHAVSLGYPIATKKPYVVTIHDLGPLSQPQFFPGKGAWIMSQSFRQAVKKADRLICVSQATANEVEQFGGKGVAERIQVVHEGVSDFFRQSLSDDDVQSCLKKYGLVEKRFFLCAGALSPRKNVKQAILAFAEIADSVEQDLVLVGGQGWSNSDILSALEKSSIKQRVHLLGYVSNEELRALYQKATAYLYPSFYEGFGLTILEAMACHCPVITSDRTSLPEVAGDAAILVNPDSAAELSEAMKLLAQDSGYAQQLVERGKERLRHFSWSGCASAVAEIYKQLT